MSNTYYLSATGCDQNDGLSPECPFQTFEKMATVAQPGDWVLFKRGDIFRRSEVFYCPDGVSYDAYGEGNKPRIYGSACNYAQKELWEPTDEPDLWKCAVGYEGDACHIVYDEGAAWSVRRRSLAEVTEDLDYFYDYDQKAVFLRCDGHPAERFSSIEMGQVNLFILPKYTRNIAMRNLDIRHTNYAVYTTCSGLQDVENVSFEYCDFSWIGGHEGHYAPGGVRDGNAINFWGNARKVFIDHCTFYQIFDAAFTPQCSARNNTDVVFEDMTMSNCRIEKCHYSIEFWVHVKDDDDNSIGTIRNICIENNHFIGAGEGWDACQRWNSAPPEAASHFQTMSHHQCGTIENVVLRNNIFERASHDLISFYWNNAVPVLEGNTYIQVKGRPFGHIGGGYYLFDDTAEEAIRQFDKTATVRFAEE